MTNEIVTLEDVAEILMGQSPPGSTYNTDGNGMPFFQGKTDFGDIYPTVRMYCTEPKRIAEVNDILISVRAPVGPTNLNAVKSIIGRGLAAVRPKDNTDLKYLLYFLQFYEPRWSQVSKGSTFEAISREDLESIRVPMLPLPEQRRIAALLDKADRLRRTLRYAAQLSDTFLQAVFVRMFGDPVQNPLGWEEVALDELVTFISGKSFKFSEYVPQGVRLFQIANVSFQETNWDTLAYLPTNYLEEYPQLVLNPGDLLMALNRPILGEKVKFAVLSENDCPSILYQHVGKITVKSEKIIQPFLFGLMHTRYFYHELKKRLAGSDQPYINPTELVEMRVYVPPLALQQKFARIVQQFERLRAQQREAERQAEQLFQTLLHRAFAT